MLLVEVSYSYVWRKVHVISCVLEIPTIESWTINEVYEKILFAGLESWLFKQSKITHGW